MKEKILILDGTYLAYRSFFAMNKTGVILKNEDGFSTNTVLLFFRTLFTLLLEHRTPYVFVAFDAKGKTFRHEMYDKYKDGRAKMPKEFYDQINLIKDLLTNINIFHYEVEGFEADDIIANVCKHYPFNYKLIFSADQDLNQLIDKNTNIIKKHKNSIIILNNENFSTIYDFEPWQVVDYKAIVGDNSDNFFGIKGIGPKTAAKLLKEYGSLDNIYANLENIKPIWAEKFQEYKSIAFRDQTIARLVTNFEIPNLNLDNMSIYKLSLKEETIKLLDKYQLNTIKQKISSLIKMLH
ncbi:DNA polymerase I [Metamycoplasma phocicerebrale]|uniref:5'-3' exonuclease n=1 Tax=Metamycoplasma phocicerebrale TaxID=142649 RepID=A0A3Q9VBG5_9BACT|nr:5'-3' exonuclease H3TH domain-containing protein [Metamycoplasma phocicerebrale]AZZ65299.1 DNA polymerase I [Metamycoplasma phocicerebrale]